LSKGGSVARGKSRGYYVERKLVKLLRSKSGNYVFRVPVSGSRQSPKSNVALPDVFLVNNAEGRVVAFEVKGTSEGRVRVPREQVVKLFKFLDAFKRYERREAVIAVWFFSSRKWVFRRVEEGLELEDVVVREEDESNWSP